LQTVGFNKKRLKLTSGNTRQLAGFFTADSGALKIKKIL
jgi:hypothetical protein